MKIFLTGGTGFIGSNFIQYALKKNHVLIAIKNKKTNINNKKNKNLIWLDGRLNDNFYDYMKKCDVLVHLAAHGVSPKNTSLKNALKYNCEHSQSLLRQSIKADIKKVILVGTSQEYGLKASLGSNISVKSNLKPMTNYAISKVKFYQLSKKMFKDTDVKVTYLRIFNAYGKGQSQDSLWGNLQKKSKLDQNVFIKNPNRRLDLININSVVNSIEENLRFQKNKKGVMLVKNIGSGKPITIKKFVEKEWKKMKSIGKINYKVQND